MYRQEDKEGREENIHLPALTRTGKKYHKLKTLVGVKFSNSQEKLGFVFEPKLAETKGRFPSLFCFFKIRGPLIVKVCEPENESLLHFLPCSLILIFLNEMTC